MIYPSDSMGEGEEMALKNQPYLPLYVNDFLLDDGLLNCSAESTGVYIRLMCILHKQREYGRLILEDFEVAQLAQNTQNGTNSGAKDTQESVRIALNDYAENTQNTKDCDSMISAFARKLMRYMPYDYDVIYRSIKELFSYGCLNIEGNQLYQKRMVRDNEISQSRALAGARGGGSGKSTSAVSNDSSNEKDLLLNNKKELGKECASKKQAKYKQNTENENEYENEHNSFNSFNSLNKKDLFSANNAFEIFWLNYPRKKDKKRARIAFGKVCKSDSDLQEILQGIEKQKDSKQWQNEVYIPYPSTFLNGERWLDEVDVPQVAKKEPSAPDHILDALESEMLKG